MVGLCCSASFPHTFEDPGLAVFTYLGISSLEALLVGEVFAFEFSVLRMAWVCLDMILGK
jgi:hypothetical protein